MTQWDARASAILHEHATNVAVYSIAVSMVFWLASQVKKHCCAQQQSVPAAQSKGSRNRSSKHTHWTRRVPGTYTYLTWGMAVISASLCASTKQADFLFGVNLLTCVFACIAQRALARARLRSGWIRKARRVGKARVKARRQPGSPRSRMQMLIATIFLFSPASWVCVEGVCQGNIAAGQRVRNAWSTSRKLRNQLMRAMHGNTMKKGNRRQAEESTPSQCIETSAGSKHVASKKARVADEVDAASSLRAQPSNPSVQKEVEEEEDRKMAVRVQTRIGCELIKIPGDGWCFFHAVLRHCRGWQSWSTSDAAKLYLQALEWMCKQKNGPRAHEVAIASVPFDDREAGLHLGFLQQAEQLEAAEGLTAAEIVLWSKVVAVLGKPRMLDSIHHGSVVELWALIQAFDFHCLIWSQEDNKNIWIREMAYITDAETQQKLQEHPNVLELFHRNTGITGHYDLVQRAEALREPFPETPWLETWRTQSAEAVLCLAAESLRNPVEVAPMSPQSQSSHVEDQRARIENEVTEDAERPTAEASGQLQQTSRPTAAESDATTCQPNRSQQVHDTTEAGKEAATGVWEGHDDAEASEGAATDLDSESVLSWDSNLSESTEEAEVEVTVDSTKTWVTVEDRDQERIRRTASHLRQHSLLPSPAAMTEFPSMQPNSGLVYPAVHCAFEGCGWASDTQPCHPHWSKEKVWNMKATTWAHTTLKCCGNEVGCLWAHLAESHSEHFADIPRELVASTYTAALIEKERGQVPQVGWSVDRRTLRRLRVDLDDNTCQALICACCARVSPGGMGGEIAYISVEQLFNALTPEAVKANWNLESYMTQYGTVAAVTSRFAAHEWTRILPETICDGMQLICCPEDLRCEHCTANALHLCEACELPLCRSCVEHMCKPNACAVPEALANDNWFGYPTELLYTHKVRWIEAAAASPVWTSVINYYLEADRGNLIEEHVHRPQHRTAIRGNVSSFSIPWEEVLAALAPETRQNTSWERLPHPPHVLQAIVKVNIKGMLYNEAIEWVAGARIRPWVVSALLHHLIDIQHPMCASDVSAEEAKAAVTQRVTRIYGVDETRPVVDWNEPSSPTGTASTARPCARRQSSAQAAVSVNSEVTTAKNETDAPTTSGQSSLEPASAVQHFRSSLEKTASPQTVPHLQSEETTPVCSKTVPQHTSHSAESATTHDLPAQRVCQMVATAEGIADSTSAQKAEETVSAASHRQCPFTHVKPERDASPGNAPAPQVTSQSSAQATTAGKGQEKAAPTPASQPRIFVPASANASQPLPQKHATPEAVADIALNGESFVAGVRPNVLSQDYTGAEWRDPDVDMLFQLSNATDTLTIRTGHNFWDQWQNDFLPWAFPFSIPAPVSGPDFPHKERPRRPPDAPHLQPLAHLKLLAGRIESSIRNSWDLIPGLRRLTFKWHSVWQGSLWRKWKSQRQAIATTPMLKWVQAARGLYNKLRSGTYTTAGGKPKPIHFDTRKLPYARGLTTDEKELLQDVKGMQGHMPGTIEVRRRIGRFLFGARVEMGEPLFITISPTTRHNTLCIKFSRYRAADPGGTAEGARDRPRLWETAEATIDVPPYDTRRQLAARDPWAVVLSFQTVVRCIFAKLLGIRMCFRCPACNCRDARGHGCHVTGGVLGIVCGLCGAIEYQANSTPHFHCNVYIASIWQQSLSELAAKLNDSTITFEDVQQFLTWAHPESHLDLASHTQQQDHLEADWAQNNCKASHDFLCQWPKFLAEDQAVSPWLNAVEPKQALADASRFIHHYRRAAQGKISHQQLHWHPWNIVQKCRLPIAGCRKKGAPNKCKHSFPKVLNERVRVICRGNARKFAQSTAGRRNALGLVLDKRDDPWLSGTTHAFALMLFGNSHTAINFRVPLSANTHDTDCTRGCLAKNTLPRLQRAMAQAARRSTRYFTGYLQKPQPLGRKELQQAAKQLHFLEEGAAKDDPAAHYRKVVHRVFGDLEFRCSVRPVTEEFMLAGFSNMTDPTTAECIRSFPVVPFLGMDWLSILDAVTEVRHKIEPPNPYKTTIKTSEIYGWRGADERVFYLSPWEFIKWWSLKKLQPPTKNATEDGQGLSVWVRKEGTDRKPADGWQYGRDYIWKHPLPNSRAANLVRLPQCNGCSRVQEYYLERRTEPLIPYPTTCPLPKPDMSKDAQARLLNVYLRPWTLDLKSATPHVPHISALDLEIRSNSLNPSKRLFTKTAPGPRSHHLAWRAYIQQYVVSEHAARTIRNFLSATECDPEEVDLAETPAQPTDHEVDTTWVTSDTIDKLVRGVGFESSKRSGPAVRRIVEEWEATPQVDAINSWFVSTGIADIKLDHSQSKRQQPTPLPETEPLSWTYGKLTPESATVWLQRLAEQGSVAVDPAAGSAEQRSASAEQRSASASQEPRAARKPTAEQLTFLRAVVDRCLTEAQEEQVESSRSEPLRAVFHGVPGAGKTQTLKWLRAFFEELCGWQHQQEFVYLAPQNTQAALIAGMTLHSFANIQVKNKTSRAKNTSTPEQFAKYQRLRWLVVDESSTVGLEILATLEKRLQQATRDRDTWKLRPGGERRPFGGRNIILTGDFWQFPPVKATAIYQNPFQSNTSFQVNALQQLCWSHTPLAIPHLFELTLEQRCEDAWLSQILHQARHGNMSQEVWSFLHGFPTLHAGSWSFQSNEATCGQTTCNNLHLQPTAPNQLECVSCRQERARRCIVGKDPKAEHFLTHPFVHGLNAAKYIAANLRAKWVATTRKHKLLWIIAQDTPLFHVEPTELQARRENWLQRHDQSTGGVVGIFPLLQNMPIRVTQTLPDLKAFGLFKNTRGTLWNWTLHEADQETVGAVADQDIVLQRLPRALYVKVEGATWQQHPDLPVGVARIEPVTQTWTLETNGKATVSRRGFPIASDYAGTAHSFMGATLGACTLDLGTWDATTSREAQLSGYMCLSRVRRSEDLCIVQPFSPNLFSHGELIGPHTFLEVHREKLTLAQAKIRFEKDKPNKVRNRDIMLFCRGCSSQPHLEEKLLPLREFVSAWDPEEWFRVLSEGMSRLCTQCKTKQSNPPAKGKPKEVGSCAYCQTLPADLTGYCSKCATIRLACSKCDIGKKIKTKRLVDFSPEEIRRRKKTKELRRARCKKCAVAPVTAKAKQGLCSNCNKAISVSHLVNYRADSQTGICRACVTKQVRAPKTCAQCAQPLHANATPGTWCTACAFPPCSGGCGQPRPQRAPNHAKQKAHWYCQKCTVKSCPKCGEVLGAKAAGGAWCLACTYPPCESCGSQRPQESRYHVKVMPHWTCEACTVKSCPKCGEVLGSKAQTGALCLACAYPPCESCGSERPRRSGYHVAAMPRWTCEACSVKSCPMCGQSLDPKAQDGAWCLACAYPPCNNCGRPRPRTRSEYHAQVMPRWTCEACRGNSLTGVPRKRLRRS